jgi:hypothetical protein
VKNGASMMPASNAVLASVMRRGWPLLSGVDLSHRGIEIADAGRVGSDSEPAASRL